MLRSDILKSLALSEAEEAILAVVEKLKMAATLARISRLADRPRTSTLYTLKKLTKWKFLRMVEDGKHKFWMNNTKLR